MTNPLTGDFEAVLQVSGATVNRLLASMQQNDGSKPALPGFPHGIWIRIGDPDAIDVMRTVGETESRVCRRDTGPIRSGEQPAGMRDRTHHECRAGPTVTLRVRLAKSSNPYKDCPHSASYESVISTKPSTLRFGAAHSGGQAPGNFFAGRIDNVAFYNGVLAQSDIDKHFNML